MAANAVHITIDDSNKTLRFGETLTSGSTYAVSVDGGRAVAGNSGVLVIIDEYGLQVASCKLSYGEGTLSTDTEEMRKRVKGAPTGSFVPFQAYVRDVSNGQNVAAGLAMVEVVDHWTGGEAKAKQISYVGAQGQRGESAYELAVKAGFRGTLQEWLQSLTLHSAYAYDPEDGRLKPIVVYTNASGEKVPTIDLDGMVMDGLPMPVAVVADGTVVGRTLGERFAEVANVLDFGAWGEGDLYRQEDGKFKSLDDYCKEAGPYSDQQWEDMTDAQRKDVRDSVYPNLPAHHDDTDAIQAAINHVAAHGGGVVYFPCLNDLKRFYRIDKTPYKWYNPTLNEGSNLEPSQETAYSNPKYTPGGNEGYYTDKPYFNPIAEVLTDDEYRTVGEGASATTVRNEENKEPWLLKSQLYIPPGSNVSLVGEVRPISLKHYHVPGESTYGFYDNRTRTTQASYNVVLRSSVDVEEKVGYQDRPWAVIAAPEGEKLPELRVKSSSEMVSIINMEVRVHLDCYGGLQVIDSEEHAKRPRFYPTMGAVNLMNVRRMHIENCFFGIDNAIGSNASFRCLQHSPTTTVGLFGAIEDCAEHKIENLTVQGFKFGVVLPEMVNANFIHISNTEYALCFLDATHLSVIDHLSTHNNSRCICALPLPMPTWEEYEVVVGGVTETRYRTTEYPHPFGCEIRYQAWDAGWDSRLRNQKYRPQVNVIINAHDYEHGHFSVPPVSWMRWGIWDPQDRMYGSVHYHQGYPGDKDDKRLLYNFGKADQDGINYQPDRMAKRFASDGCYYDHRYSGVASTLFDQDTDTDVAAWMASDWAEEEMYDFVYKTTAADIDLNDTNTYGFVREGTYFLSPALPPCPCFPNPNNSESPIRYEAPKFGSYYPVLGASHMAKVPVTDIAAHTSASSSLQSMTAGATDLISTITYGTEANVYVYVAPKSGWFVVEGAFTAAATIRCRVLRNELGMCIYSSAVDGRGTDVATGFTVPCPAGGRIETWIAGGTMTNLTVCRFVPCGAEVS